MNNKMITIPYADAIEYGENTSVLFKALWELTDLIRLESDLKKHHRAYLHVREDISEKSIFIEDMFCFIKSKPLSAIKSSVVKRAGFDET